MSWLNLNDSLSNLKGQITNFATDLLADGIVNDTDPFTELGAANKKIQELQNLCASQEVEIGTLRRQNEEFHNKLLTKPSTSANVNEAVQSSIGDEWFWDPPDNSTQSSGSSNLGASTSSDKSLLHDVGRLMPGESDGSDALRKEIAAQKQRINDLESESAAAASSQRTKNADDEEFQKLNTKLIDLEAENNRLQIDTRSGREADELRKRIEELEVQNQMSAAEIRTLEDSLTQLDADCQQTTEKLVALKDSLQLDCNELKKDCDALKRENEALRSGSDALRGELQSRCDGLVDEKARLDGRIAELQSELDDERRFRDAEAKRSEELGWRCRSQNEKCAALTDELERLKSADCRVELNGLKDFVLKICEIIKRFLGIDVDASKLIESVGVDEFLSQIEMNLREHVDYKRKTQTLEKKTCELSYEKTLCLQEKIKEIEKLTEDNEFLNEELKNKSEQLEHSENECNELSNNNDLLISRLEMYNKNDGGLQTISETNEDNVLQLELQLENANRRIGELERRSSTENDSDTERLREATRESNAARAELNRIRFENEDLEKKVSELTRHADSLSEQLSSTVSLNNELSLKSELFKNDLDLLKNELQSAQNNVDRLTEKNERLEQSCRELEIIKEENAALKRSLSLCQSENASATESLLRSQNLREIEIGDLKKEIQNLNETINELTSANEALNLQTMEHERLTTEQSSELELLRAEKATVETSELKLRADEIANLHSKIERLENESIAGAEKIAELVQTIDALSAEKQELVNLVSLKHNENIQYHAEIQRLNGALIGERNKCKKFEEEATSLASKRTNDEDAAKLASLNDELRAKIAEMERLSDRTAFLQEKCDVLTKKLLEEQSKMHAFSTEHQNCAERRANSSRELERLRQHLMETEESHTREMLESEQRIQEMATRMVEMQQRERDSSTMYTSVSVRANQQVETLQNQIRLMTQQRDEYQTKLSASEDKRHKQTAALTNLQCVLEQFQRDKEKEIQRAVDKVQKQVSEEKQRHADLRKEIESLKCQLSDSKQGLKAASRLQEQLEKARHQVCTLKDEVTKLQDERTRSERRCQELTSQTDAKVDKMLIKNLIIGYVSTGAKDREQILKIIGTVLDFTKKEEEKLNLNKQNASGSWLGSLLHPQSGAQISQQSLSEAFVRFLESESQPKQIPNLLNVVDVTGGVKRRDSNASQTSSAGSTRQTPLLLTDVVLPTFTEFAQNRNSSSILKDVLKDNK